MSRGFLGPSRAEFCRRIAAELKKTGRHGTGRQNGPGRIAYIKHLKAQRGIG
jgi:hypothetical protein